MNLIVNDIDQPLIIKVASIPQARMQVYFIDNEEYFKRKFTTEDKKATFILTMMSAHYSFAAAL